MDENTASVAPVVPPQDLGSINIIAKAIPPTASSEDRLGAIPVINKKIENDKEGHSNTHTDWVHLGMALVGGNGNEMLKAWNGGPTFNEAAYHPSLGKFIRQRNQRGETGRVFTAEGQELTPAEIKDLNDSGGLISKADQSALQTGTYKATSAIKEKLTTGLAAPVAEAYGKSYAAAKQGTVLRDNFEQLNSITQSAHMQPVFKAISALKPEQRQELFGAISKQISTSAGNTAQKEAGQNISASVNKNAQNTVGGNVGLGGKAGVAPEGGIAPKIGADISGSLSRGIQTSANASERAGSTEGQTFSNANTAQSNIASEINKYVQGAITKPEQFTDLQRFVQLNGMIGEAQAKMQQDVMGFAPGTKQLAPVEAMMNSTRDIQKYSNDSLRNNALNVAWNSYLANEIHANLKTVSQETIDTLQKKFESTKIYRAIQRTYDLNNDVIDGKKSEHQEGMIYVDKNNRLRRKVSADEGNWEPVNVK